MELVTQELELVAGVGVGNAGVGVGNAGIGVGAVSLSVMATLTGEIVMLL